MISSSPGNRIQLQFLSLSLESSSGCYYDYVEVREGKHNQIWGFSTYIMMCTGSEDGDILATICDSETQTNLSSVSGHILYIKFKSDSSISGDGFQAYYEHIYGSTTIRWAQKNFMKLFGIKYFKFFSEFNGTISSPLYPAFYPNYVDAYYYVYASFGFYLSYHFTLFDLEQPSSVG